MTFPITVTFRGVPPSPAVETRVRQKAEKLARFNARITSCHVIVDAPHRHKTKGDAYAVHVRIGMPGHEVVVSHDHPQAIEHEDVFIALRDAFDALRRRLEDHTRRVRGDVKQHEAPLTGHVVRVDEADGCGFVETTDGLQVYFNENSVMGARLADLRVGSEVRISWVEGEGGPRATAVEPVG